MAVGLTINIDTKLTVTEDYLTAKTTETTSEFLKFKDTKTRSILQNTHTGLRICHYCGDRSLYNYNVIWSPA